MKLPKHAIMKKISYQNENKMIEQMKDLSYGEAIHIANKKAIIESPTYIFVILVMLLGIFLYVRAQITVLDHAHTLRMQCIITSNSPTACN